mmetsp:Transcript_5008/g.15779  ORF Transcript_5008/g.15779 Transcript_5008/m.15779 type:complete len:317 (+) Transcript_5008:85-1035(+)
MGRERDGCERGVNGEREGRAQLRLGRLSRLGLRLLGLVDLGRLCRRGERGGGHRGRHLLLVVCGRRRVGKGRRRRRRLEAPLRHAQVGVESDGGGGGEGERHEEAERVPEPEVRENAHPNDGGHDLVAGAASERDRHVAPAGVEQARRHDGAKLGHRVLVLIAHHLLQVFAVLGLARLRLVVRVLHKDHRRGQQRALPHVVDRVGQHRSEQIERFLGSRAGARDADGEGRAVAHVRVVRLGQQLDHARALRRRVGQHKPDCDDGGAPHIVRHIRDGHVQAGAQRRVGAGAGVGKGDGVHGAVAENRVRLVQQRGHQ